MRGTPQTQIFEGRGGVIADSAAGEISYADALYALPYNGRITEVTDWTNWCGNLSTTQLGVAVVLPFALGRLTTYEIDASALLPTCTSSASPAVLTAHSWEP